MFTSYSPPIDNVQIIEILAFLNEILFANKQIKIYSTRTATVMTHAHQELALYLENEIT